MATVDFEDLEIVAARYAVKAKSQLAAIRTAYEQHGDGLNLKSTSREQWVMVLPDLDSKTGGYRLQHFDAKGFFAHSCHANVDAALEAAQEEGYCEADPGRLDVLSLTETWRRGIQVNAIIQRLNAGLITWEEANALHAQIH